MDVTLIKENLERKIAQLQEQLSHLNSNSIEYCIRGTWVINSRFNTYYQFESNSLDVVTLKRKGQISYVTKKEFYHSYVRANEKEVEQHLKFLRSIGQEITILNKEKILDFSPKLSDQRLNNYVNPKNLDFYMVTVTGEHGSKVRHESYEVAEKEAIRLATKKNHEAFIVGVIASVKPKTEIVKTVTYEVLKR